MAIQYRGTGTSGNSGASSVTTQAITLPVGQAAGDILFLVLQMSSSAVTGISQTGGTGTWTTDFTAQFATANSTYFFAHRVMQAGDSAPTFSWTTSTGDTWSCGGFYSDASRPLVLDKFAVGDPLIVSSAATTATPNAVTAASSSEASLILTCVKGLNSASATTHTYTPPTGWTFNDGDGGWNNVAAGKPRAAFNCYQLGQSGTVTPGAETLTDNASNTYFWEVVHALVSEIPLIKAQVVMRMETISRSAGRVVRN